MSDFGLKSVQELKRRLIKEGFNTNDCSILFISNSAYLNGIQIEGEIAISKDKKWICIPIHDEEQEVFFGDYIYKPKCYEILYHLNTYLPCGSMMCLTDVFILNQ